MPSFNGMPDIWDLYSQMQVGSRGWTPPGGIEGSPNRNVVTTSGNSAWMANQPGAPQEPLPEPPPSPGNGGGMPDLGQGGLMNQMGAMAQNLQQGGTMRRNQTYFPNANPGAGTQQFPMAPGVAQGQAGMNQIANASNYSSRRLGGQMVNSPNGGSMWVPTGKLQGYLDKGYSINTPPRTPVQQFDLNQSYSQGYGAPSPTIQQGAGGSYRIAGGVAAPYGSAFPNLQRFGSDIATAARGARAIAGGVGTFAANTFNNLFNRQQPSQPSYASTGPRRYFDY